MTGSDALELAFGKGNLKKWSLEKALKETLFETKPEYACYLKLDQVNPSDYDEEKEDEYIVNFGYAYRIPRTRIYVHIDKKTHKLTSTRDSIGYGFDEVEQAVVDYLLKQKKKGNLIYQSNYNDISFPIK